MNFFFLIGVNSPLLGSWVGGLGNMHETLSIVDAVKEEEEVVWLVRPEPEAEAAEEEDWGSSDPRNANLGSYLDNSGGRYFTLNVCTRSLCQKLESSE